MENVSKREEIEALDVALRALSRQRAQSAHALCHHLLTFDALNGPASLGFASIREYGEHVLGLTAREIRECLRVGRRLRVLSGIDTALEAGTLSWSAARALTRVVVPETEAEWPQQAQSGPMRELEAAVSVSSAGDLPPDADKRPVAPARTRFVFEVDSIDAQIGPMFRRRAGMQVKSHSDFAEMDGSGGTSAKRRRTPSRCAGPSSAGTWTWPTSSWSCAVRCSLRQPVRRPRVMLCPPP